MPPNPSPDAAGLHHLPEAGGVPITLVARLVGEADDAFARLDPSQRCSVSIRPGGTTLLEPITKSCLAAHGEMEAVAVVGAHMSVGRLTKPHCLLKHRVEYRREIARRA